MIVSLRLRTRWDWYNCNANRSWHIDTVSYCVRVANDCERLPALDVSQTWTHTRSVLVALRLKRLESLMRLSSTIIITVSMGELRHWLWRISTSQISVIFYGIMTLNTASLVVNAALWGLKEAIYWSSGRLLSSSIELARPFRGLQIASCWLVGVGY